MEKLKRVICWDLWGTLITSTYRGETYEDVLVNNEMRYLEPRDRASLKATVRSLLMTYAARQRRSFDLAISCRKHLPYDWCASLVVGQDRFTSRDMVTLWEKENEAAEWLSGAKDVFRTLKKWGKQVLVSNTTEPGWQTVNKKLCLTHHQRFGGDIILSCELPVAKPDPFVWQTVEQRYPADEYWMIGNDPIFDIAVPKTMGWETILVNHPDGVPLVEVPRIIGQEVR